MQLVASAVTVTVSALSGATASAVASGWPNHYDTPTAVFVSPGDVLSFSSSSTSSSWCSYCANAAGSASPVLSGIHDMALVARYGNSTSDSSSADWFAVFPYLSPAVTPQLAVWLVPSSVGRNSQLWFGAWDTQLSDNSGSVQVTIQRNATLNCTSAVFSSSISSSAAPPLSSSAFSSSPPSSSLSSSVFSSSPSLSSSPAPSSSSSTAPAAPVGVQFSFCAAAGTANPAFGVQTPSTYRTLVSGVLTTTALLYNAGATYTVSSVSATYAVSGSSVTYPAQLPAPNAVTFCNDDGCGSYYLPYDQRFTLSTSSSAVSIPVGLAVSSSISSLLLTNRQIVACTLAGSCGTYGTLNVQLYNASNPTFVIPCTPISATVRFSFCFETGTANPTLGPQTTSTYRELWYGLLNTTALTYSPTGTYVASSFSDGFTVSSSNGTPQQAFVVAPNSVSFCDEDGCGSFYLPYNNQFTLQAGSTQVVSSTVTLGFGSAASDVLLYHTNVYCTAGNCGTYGSLQVQLYDASSGVMPCTPVTNTIQFSFCFETGTINPSTGNQTSASFRTAWSGILTTTALVYSPTGTYVMSSVSNGSFISSTMGNSSTVLVVPPGSISFCNEDGCGEFYIPYDNVFTLRMGTAQVAYAEGLALGTSAASAVLYGSSQRVSCTVGDCGLYGTFSVQLYSASTGAVIPCEKPQSPPVAASTSAVFSSSISSSATPPSSTSSSLGTSSLSASLSAMQPSSSPLSFGSSSPLPAGDVIAANASLSSLNPAPFSGRRLARGVQQSLYSNPYLPSIFLVGGQGTAALTDAIWQSTDGGVSWSPLGSNLTLSAIPTYMGSAVALFVNGVLTIYGGQLANGTATSFVATLNTLSSSLLPLTLYSAPWTPRYNHAYTTLPASNVTVFCAGLSSVASVNTSDCWMGAQPELGSSSWTQLTASGPFPSSLSSAAVVSLYDNTSTLLLCGGAVVSAGLGSAINTCWVSLTLGVTWSSAIPAAWAARTEVFMTSDLNGWAYLYGGLSTSTGLYFYDLWLSTDKAQHWLPVLLPPGVQLNVQEGCLALYYTQQYVSGAVVTVPQLVLYSGAQPSTGGGYVLGDYFAPVFVSGLVSSTPPLSSFSLSLPLLASECQFTFNVAGTLTGFGVSSANPNAALVAGYIAALVGAILGVPASAVQVCVHVTYAYPGTLRSELYLYSAAAGLVGVVNNITAATNTTLMSTPTTIPVTASLTTASSSSGSSTQSAVGGSSSGALASSSASSSTSSSSTGAAAAYSDPRFVGFWGQSFFVGGRAGGVYNLLSDADVQANAHFVQLSNVTCPLVDGRAAERCYVEAGTYFGVLSVMVRGGAYVRITGGGHDEGFHSVRIQDQISIEVGDSWDGAAMGHGEEGQGVVEAKGAQRLLLGRKGGAANADSGEHSPTSPTFTVHRPSHRLLHIRAGVYELQVVNMDQYVDVATLDVSCWQCVVEQLRPEGLLGQTWNATASVKHSEDEVEQYRERDDHLLGCKHRHDRFCSAQHSKQQQQH